MEDGRNIRLDKNAIVCSRQKAKGRRGQKAKGRCREELKKEIEEFFNVHLESKKETELTDLLSEFCDVFGENIPSIPRPYPFIVSCNYLLRHLYENNSADVSAISRVLLTYVYSLDTHFRDYSIRSSLAEILLSSRISEEYPLLNVFRDGVLPYTEWNSSFFSELFVAATKRGYYGFFLFLAKYGKGPVPSHERIKLSYVKNYILGWRSDTLSRRFPEEFSSFGVEMGMPRYLFNGEFSDRRFALILFALDTLGMLEFWQSPRGKECIGHRVKWKKISRPEDIMELCHMKARCVRMLFEMTPEPYLTYRDIRRFFDTFFSRPRTQLLLEWLRESVQRLFPLCQEFYQPRSLQDLCRCRIRDSIGTSTPMPLQIGELPIEPAHKAFILFHNKKIGDFFQREESIQATAAFDGLSSGEDHHHHHTGFASSDGSGRK